MEITDRKALSIQPSALSPQNILIHRKHYPSRCDFRNLPQRAQRTQRKKNRKDRELVQVTFTPHTQLPHSSHLVYSRSFIPLASFAAYSHPPRECSGAEC